MLGLLGAIAVGAVTNMPPPYYGVYAAAVDAPPARQVEILALPLHENVRGNSTYVNTRRYLLGPDNPNFLLTPDGSGLGADGRISAAALEVQAQTTANAAEAARCRALARWLAHPDGPSPRAALRAQAAAAVARAAQLPHPRVFATADDFAALKARARTDALVRSGIDRALSAADGWIGKPVATYGLDGYRLLGVARLGMRRLLLEAFAYRMTGKRAYVADAVRELKALCAFPDWNPRHTIDQGELALAVATAYDWMFDALDAADRREIAAALEKHALRADVPFAGWTRLQNNWVQVVAAGLTASAVALADCAPQLCADHLAAIAECLPEAEAVCGPDGVYTEGPGYWNYGMGFNVVCLDVMRTAFGHDFGLSEVKGFRETGLYPALVTGPSGDWFNYSDSHGARGSSPAVWWYARRLGMTAAVTDGEVAAFRAICDGTAPELPRTLPFILFWVGEDLASAKGALPGVWLGQGEMPLAVLSGDRADPQAAYLAIKGGSPSYNHAHADAGCFVLDLAGLRWGFDLGSENYGQVEQAIGGSGLWSPEPGSKRWTVFRLGTQGHNTLLIDGQGQDPRGFATLTRDGEGILADLSSVYPQARKVTRRATVCGRSVTLVDTIEGARPGAQVRWAMNTDAVLALPAESGAPCVRCAKNGVVIEVGETSAHGTWSEGSAQPPHAWEQPNPGMRQLIYTTKIEADGNLVISVLFCTVPGNRMKDERDI